VILVAGGAGRLGSLVVDALSREGTPVRVLTRSAESAERLRARGVDVVVGDVREPKDAARAVDGCSAIVSAVTGFAPTSSNPQQVDRDGNLHLIAAASGAGAERFVLVSVHGAAPDARIPLFRMKYAAEQALREAALSWTIVRPTAYVETHLGIIGASLRKKRATLIFGSGRVPMNFVSVQDVAALVLRALRDDALSGRVIDIGGFDATMEQLSAALHAEAGTSGKVSRVPLGALRVMSVAARPFSPFLARAAQSSVVTNTSDMRFDPMPDRATVPGLPFTTLQQVMAGRATTSSGGVPVDT
jgi:uncharacterized protein YbjT (DUF2867 family)